MYEFFFTALLLAIPVVFVFRWMYMTFRARILRHRFFQKLKTLCQQNNYELRKVRVFGSSFYCHSSKPDLVIVTPDTEYLLRFIACKDKDRCYHFPTSEYYVSSLRQQHVMSGMNLNVSARFKHLPPLAAFFLQGNTDMKKVQVLLFNPAPREISYVNAEKIRKIIAQNGEKFENTVFYNATGFLELLQNRKNHLE